MPARLARTRRPGSGPLRVAASTVLAAGCCAALAGCGGDDPEPRSTVTVTATPTPSITEEPEGGDVTGRTHDVGTVVDVKQEDGRTILRLDRWTLVGVDDGTLARAGAPVTPYTGERFTNQNSERTYTVPVAEDATLVVNECTPPATPGGTPGLTSRPGDLAEFLARPDLASAVVLLTYADGELTQLDTDPRCG